MIRRTIACIGFLFLPPICWAQSTPIEFADPQFKAYLLSHTWYDMTGGSFVPYDLNGDNEISYDEAALVTGYVDVDDDLITDVEGLQFFVNMRALRIWDDELVAMPGLSGHEHLEHIDVMHTNISSRTFENMPELRSFIWSNSELQNLSVSNTPLLEDLDINSNRLTSLTISNAPALNFVMAANNQLTSLGTEAQPNMVQLTASLNELPTFDFSLYPNVVNASLRSNRLTSITIPENSLLENLNISDNLLPELEISNQPNLMGFDCSNNLLTTLTLTNIPELFRLDCNTNEIETLILEDLPDLRYVYLQDNRIADLDFSLLPPDTLHGSMDVSNNLLTDLTSFVELPYFGMSFIDSLDVRHNDLREDVCDQINLLEDRFTQYDADFFYDPQNGGFVYPHYDWWPEFNVIDLIFGTVVEEYPLICP